MVGGLGQIKHPWGISTRRSSRENQKRDPLRLPPYASADENPFDM